MSLRNPLGPKHSQSVIPPLSRVSLKQRVQDEGLTSKTGLKDPQTDESSLVRADGKKEYYLDEKGNLRARIVRDTPKPPDYFSDGRAYYIVSDELPTLLTVEEVCGMLGFDRKHFLRTVLPTFEKMGAVSRFSRKAWRIARWAVLKLSNYQGRCGNCGRPWEDYLDREFRQRRT